MDRQSDRFSTLSDALTRCEKINGWAFLDPHTRVSVVARAMFGEALVTVLDFALQDTDDLTFALFGMLVGREWDEENATGKSPELLRRIGWLDEADIEDIQRLARAYRGNIDEE